MQDERSDNESKTPINAVIEKVECWFKSAWYCVFCLNVERLHYRILVNA